MWPRLLFLSTALLVSGCAVRSTPQTWRLTGQALIPPGVSTASLDHGKFTTTTSRDTRPCPHLTGPVSVETRSHRLQFVVTRAALLEKPPGWLTQWALDLESRHCIPPGSGYPLAAQVAQSLPLDPKAAFRLVNPSDPQSGNADLTPGVRLQIIVPLFTAGTAADAPALVADAASGTGNTLSLTLRSTDALIGYETAWYEVQPRAGQVGSVLVPLFADRHRDGAVEHVTAPSTNYLRFGSGAAFYRLFNKAGQTEFTALVIAATSLPELDQFTRELTTGVASCSRLPAGFCVAIPHNSGINPLVVVRVNGFETTARWGSTLAEVIRQAGWRGGTVPPGLAVTKLWQGKPVNVVFDPDNKMILELTPVGGETISWNPVNQPALLR